MTGPGLPYVKAFGRYIFDLANDRDGVSERDARKIITAYLKYIAPHYGGSEEDTLRESLTLEAVKYLEQKIFKDNRFKYKGQELGDWLRESDVIPYGGFWEAVQRGAVIDNIKNDYFKADKSIDRRFYQKHVGVNFNNKSKIELQFPWDRRKKKKEPKRTQQKGTDSAQAEKRSDADNRKVKSSAQQITSQEDGVDYIDWSTPEKEREPNPVVSKPTLPAQEPGRNIDAQGDDWHRHFNIPKKEPAEIDNSALTDNEPAAVVSKRTESRTALPEVSRGDVHLINDNLYLDAKTWAHGQVMDNFIYKALKNVIDTNLGKKYVLGKRDCSSVSWSFIRQCYGDRVELPENVNGRLSNKMSLSKDLKLVEASRKTRKKYNLVRSRKLTGYVKDANRDERGDYLKALIYSGELKPGDILFFNTHNATYGTDVTHVGVYLGNGLMLHASSQEFKKHVIVRLVDDAPHVQQGTQKKHGTEIDPYYFQRTFLFAKRVES